MIKDSEHFAIFSYGLSVKLSDMECDKEKAAFYELKKRMKDDMEDDLYEDDTIFYRFLRARNLDVDLAETMLRKHLEWRKKWDVKNIFDFDPPEVLKIYFPGNFLGYTKSGDILRYFPAGNIDFRGILDCVSTDDYFKHIIKLYEEDLLLLKKECKRMGKPVGKYFYIADVKGLSLATVTDRKVVHEFIFLCKLYQDNYPETLQQIMIINASPVIVIIYSLMKSVLDARILGKIKIYKDDSYKECLLKVFDAEALPAFLGGKRTDPDGNVLCKKFINYAGSVPDKYYKRKRESFSSLPHVQKVSVPRGGIHEIPVEIEKPETYLEWEFKVKSGDIKFGIMYQNGIKNQTDVIVSLQRIATEDETETGYHKCRYAGTYIIVFDNSYSYLRSKAISYKIQVTSPEDLTR